MCECIGQILELVCGGLPPAEFGHAAGVSRRWRIAAGSATAWEAMCKRWLPTVVRIKAMPGCSRTWRQVAMRFFKESLGRTNSWDEACPERQQRDGTVQLEDYELCVEIRGLQGRHSSPFSNRAVFSEDRPLAGSDDGVSDYGGQGEPREIFSAAPEDQGQVPAEHMIRNHDENWFGVDENLGPLAISAAAS